MKISPFSSISNEVFDGGGISQSKETQHKGGNAELMDPLLGGGDDVPDPEELPLHVSLVIKCSGFQKRD